MIYTAMLSYLILASKSKMPFASSPYLSIEILCILRKPAPILLLPKSETVVDSQNYLMVIHWIIMFSLP